MAIPTTHARSVLKAEANARRADLCTNPARSTGNPNLGRRSRRKGNTVLSVPTRTEPLHPDEIASLGDNRVLRANRIDCMRIS